MPRGLAITLRPYQCHGLAWLQYLRAQHLAGILADDMGLGKTAQALAHVLMEKEAGRLDRPALVVVPTSLLFNWQAEAQRMTPSLRVLTLQGPTRGQKHAAMADHDLVLISYPVVWRDIDASGAAALSPAHPRRGADRQERRQPHRRRRAPPAGPPPPVPDRHAALENHLGELWAQFDFLMPGYLGDQRSFERRWRDPIEQHGETVRAQLLAQRVRPFILRRRKADVATELPPRIDTVQRLTLEGRQKTLYESVRVAADELVRRALKREGFAGSQITILDALLKLRQVCCDPYLLTGHALPRGTERAKMAWLCDTLPALVAEGRRILVFSQFTTLLYLLAQEMTRLGLPYLMLTGETPVDAPG
jgi:SNF2 family DNA or RNA helicase